MTAIRLPRAAAKLKAFAEIETASHGRAIEIRQTESAAVIVAADGHMLCRIVAPPPAHAPATPVPPFLVDARDFAKAAAAVGCSRTEPFTTADPAQPDGRDRPLLVARVNDKTVAVAGPKGEPQTIPIASGAMPNCVDLVDVIQAEAASGMTKAVGRVNPRYLQAVADQAVAMGLDTVELTFAPRWNFLLIEGTGPDGCRVSLAVAGVGEIDFDTMPEQTPAPPAATSGVTFTIPKPRCVKKSTKAKPKVSTTEALPFLGEFPF
jgi:hypothetical protein